MRRLVILRPEPGASASLAEAEKLGLDAVSMPLFGLSAVPWTVTEIDAFDGVLLTSANAIRLAGEGLASLRGLKAYAVGEATAGAARDAGFDVAAIGDAGVDRLLGSIEADLRLLHLCGEDFRAPQAPRQAITHLPVYRAAELPADPKPLAGAVVAVHSPRAGARLAEVTEPEFERSTVAIAAISREAARAAGSGWQRVEAAPVPTDRELLALAARLCEKTAGQ